ncbi:MFS transporter [Streptomyces endophyticus]|uniref:MFS transporter n=1 Tax=Streptomyces endophyticus TaxID=714166 RepID=A0ABU6F173_9ACTN|nr:MFS transporter [Streptomyces endophyticus]MEB8337749.1 MFS transporter [Streptomyces endophyticus]
MDPLSHQPADGNGHGRPPVPPKTLRRVVAAAAMGNAIEWFDYGIYGYLAVHVGRAFFPSGDSLSQMLSTFGVLAVSFAVRPFGGMVFGPLGDRIGRQRVLVLTLSLMSLATFAIGVLPTYATAGAAAPLLLVLCRMVQGFSTGGEYGGAATFMAEYAPDRRRGFFGAFLEFGTLIGLTSGAALATFVSTAVDPATVDAWAWRVPFLVALPLGAIGLYLRMRLEDTPVFQEMSEREATSKVPRRETLKHWRMIGILMAFTLLLNVTDYALLTYMPTYLKSVLGIGDLASDLVPMTVMVAMMVVILPIGALTDRIGRKPVVLTSCVGSLVLSVPAVWLIGQGSTAATVAGVAVLGLLLVMLQASVASTLPALFPAHVRYSAFAIGYNCATSLFGGTAPLAITALIASTGDHLVPGYYMAAAALLALVPLIRMPETAGRSLRAEVPAGTEVSVRV